MLMIISGIISVVALLSAALVWMVRLTTLILPIRDYALPEQMMEPSRVFPWPKPAK